MQMEMIGAQRAEKGRSTKFLIQSEGFTVSTTSRTYNFQVIDKPGESRQFSVEVRLESFQATPLKFQDGPLITRERLEQELGMETVESHAEAHMTIGQPDILQYLEKHYPPKARKWNPPAKAGVINRGGPPFSSKM
jgi:hypothetical protein